MSKIWAVSALLFFSAINTAGVAWAQNGSSSAVLSLVVLNKGLPTEDQGDFVSILMPLYTESKPSGSLTGYTTSNEKQTYQVWIHL